MSNATEKMDKMRAENGCLDLRTWRTLVDLMRAVTVGYKSLTRVGSVANGKRGSGHNRNKQLLSFGGLFFFTVKESREMAW